MKDFKKFEKCIGVKFSDKDLLTQSVVHRSYLNEHRDFPIAHNERLEFLGDAVLEIIVTERLYRDYPNPEGELTNWRAALVNANLLSEIAKEIELDNYLFLSKGESKDNQSKARQYILADAFEALIGAIYLDRGLATTKKFIERFVLSKLPNILQNQLYLDPKSRFQECAQEKLGITPHYKIIKEEGPDHAKHFTVGIYLHDELIASGLGTSKQEAQVEAATVALKLKHWN